MNVDDVELNQIKQAIVRQVNEIASLRAELAQAREEVEKLTSCGLIECAVRNPAVSEAMRHWENRAEKAEAEVERLRNALHEQAADAEDYSRR